MPLSNDSFVTDLKQQRKKLFALAPCCCHTWFVNLHYPAADPLPTHKFASGYKMYKITGQIKSLGFRNRERLRPSRTSESRKVKFIYKGTRVFCTKRIRQTDNCNTKRPAQTQTDLAVPAPLCSTEYYWRISQICPNRCTFRLNISISLPYTFQLSMCPSSGENYCINVTLVLVTLYGWRLVCWLDFNPTSR